MPAAKRFGRSRPVAMATSAVHALTDATTLLTRLPLPRTRPPSEAEVVRGAVCFPVVGAGIGLAVAATATTCALWLPPGVAAVLAVAVDLRVTGALHLDGLADSADGLAGSDRDHALAIMRDHSVGVYGMIAIGLDLLLKSAALAALVVPGSGAGAVAPVVAAYALSRAAPLPLACLLDYPRAEGTGRAIVQGLTPGRVAAGVGVAAVVAVAAGSATAAAMLAAGAIATLAVGVTARRRVGGVTGDVLGASVELAVLSALVVAVGTAP
jgi:adenosylcobinamide-GDP ribazoletransferase